MKFSKFANRFSSQAGIVQLMDDLGSALSGSNDILMLGGGNPGHIPEVENYLHSRLQDILNDPAEFSHVIGDYDPPQGEQKFIRALADLLHSQYGWDIGPDNIALTAGSQAGFFYLFNMFGGDFGDGIFRKIMFPMTPEYIGYADVGLVDDLFTARRPEIEILDDHLFKYHVNFHELQLSENVGAMCVSRPTNPTGNVLTDDEIRNLLEIADRNNVPLIVDNAYGLPFPNIIFTDAKPFWTENIIICMSLSKLGMPGVRTGIIIANPEIIAAVTNMNAVLSLALGSLGPALATRLIADGEIMTLSNNVIKPFYQEKANRALEQFKTQLEGIEYYIHKPEGAIFLWLWFPGLPVSSQELYQRLKKKGVLVISGHHFFPGLDEDWRHKHECIRVTYSMRPETVERGIKLIADEIKQIYAELSR